MLIKKLSTSGNSTVLTIPPFVMELLGLEGDSDVEIVINGRNSFTVNKISKDDKSTNIDLNLNINLSFNKPP